MHYGLSENGELHLGNLITRAFVLSCPAERAKDSVEPGLKEDLPKDRSSTSQVCISVRLDFVSKSFRQKLCLSI